ncbi:MAG: restriction endonuclease subunit S, partial [Ruminococcus sp.]|nr:restriction endonuclease subunit S [Ruminococcus sp.]
MKTDFMKDCKMVKLGEIASGFDYGMNASAIEYDGENKYIRITDIDEDSHKYLNTYLVSPNGFLDEKYIVNENDILLARTGASTGKAYLYDKNDGKLFFAGFLIRINIRNANSYFVFLQTLTERYKKWVKVMSVRSGQPGINANEYAMFKFPLPPLEIQQKIADILSTQDKLIELKQNLIDNKKQQKKWLMQNLLTGKIRLKGFSDKWEKVKLGKIADVKGGKRIPKGYQLQKENNSFPYITISDMENGNINT